MKASKRKPTQQAEQIGEDQHGLVVKWHLPDYILTLARRQKKYRVIKVEQILIPG